MVVLGRLDYGLFSYYCYIVCCGIMYLLSPAADGVCVGEAGI